MPKNKRPNRKNKSSSVPDAPNIEHVPIWRSFCEALGTEYRDAKEITGASGLTHPVEAIGVDDKNKRLVVVSSETNPRVAALLRGDVQETTDLRVLVARPLAIDLAYAARETFLTSSGSLDINKLKRIGIALKQGDSGKDEIERLLSGPTKDMIISAGRSGLSIKTHVFNILEQLHAFNWRDITPPTNDRFIQTSVDLLTKISNIDNLAGDREQGICPIPTYELTDRDWELFGSGKHTEDIKERLKELNILQYFYPPEDNLVMGLVDRGMTTTEKLENGISLTEKYGHEVAPSENVPDTKGVLELIEEMKEKGYIVDGEFLLEIGEEGRKVRSKISVRPAEGLISKMSKIILAKFDLKLGP